MKEPMSTYNPSVELLIDHLEDSVYEMQYTLERLLEEFVTKMGYFEDDFKALKQDIETLKGLYDDEKEG